MRKELQQSFLRLCWDLYADLNGIEMGDGDSLIIVERTYSGLYVLEEDDAESVGNIKFIPTGA